MTLFQKIYQAEFARPMSERDACIWVGFGHEIRTCLFDMTWSHDKCWVGFRTIMRVLFHTAVLRRRYLAKVGVGERETYLDSSKRINSINHKLSLDNLRKVCEFADTDTDLPDLTFTTRFKSESFDYFLPEPEKRHPVSSVLSADLLCSRSCSFFYLPFGLVTAAISSTFWRDVLFRNGHKTSH